MKDRDIRKAAGWIYTRRAGPDWWRPIVLTKDNPDPSNPGLSEQDAWRVFQALAKKDLMLPTENDSMGETYPSAKTYHFNFGKLEEWEEYAYFSWIQRYIPDWIRRFLAAWKTLLIASLILIVTAFVQKLSGNMGDDLYKRFIEPHVAPAQQLNNSGNVNQPAPVGTGQNQKQNNVAGGNVP